MNVLELWHNEGGGGDSYPLSVAHKKKITIVYKHTRSVYVIVLIHTKEKYRNIDGSVYFRGGWMTATEASTIP